MLLLGLALFISVLLRHCSDFLRLQSRSKFIITSSNKIVFFTVAVTLTDNLWHVFCLIKLSGNIEENPGPKLNFFQKLSICHWNLNSIAVHNFIKVSLLIAYNSKHKHDIICLSKTYLDSSKVLGDDSLEIPGYNLVRCDHSMNTKRGGVCVYYKSYFPLKVLNMKQLQECLNIEFSIGKKICRLISLYRSPSQNQEEFNTFLDNLKSNLETASLSSSFLTILIGDFNAKCASWYSKDNSTTEGSKLRLLTSQFGLNQIINEPTHITNNSPTCIDLLFTLQTNLVIESGVHSSLYPNCHHQIILAKFDLRIFYSPPYERNVWYYKQANIELIRRAIDNFDWNRALDNVSPNRQVSVFNDTF